RAPSCAQDDPSFSMVQRRRPVASAARSRRGAPADRVRHGQRPGRALPKNQSTSGTGRIMRANDCTTGWRAGRKAALAGLATLVAGIAGALAGPPDAPAVVDVPEVGRHGGSLRMLVGNTQDTRLLVVFGYARLVGYDAELELVPDILEDVEIEDGRVFTMHLRAGHRWSDGAPFTTEDFRYWWEDVATNEQLSPMGPPIELQVQDELPRVEILDERTVRYSWSKPNPFFLPALAGARP